MNKKIQERMKNIKEPQKIGSYKEEDSIFLLTNINGKIKEQTNEEREKAMQNGVNYSEMLPIEYMPKEEYMKVFYDTLKTTSKKIAYYTAYVAELILKNRGKDVVLVSLARAGSPIGVLIKRYIKFKYNIDVPHYSISIIRGKGIDKNALCYIIDKTQSTNLQFIDGWTGKGAINNVLNESLLDFEKEFDIHLDNDLAVLSDPAKCVKTYGTREDFLIPSACLNSTVSGLTSRTFMKDNIIGEYDFHGAKYYEEWEDIDVSNLFVDTVSNDFELFDINLENHDYFVPNSGINVVQKIQEEFEISDINKVKPGVGETTRVLLRRIPWKILVDSLDNPNLTHILLLAKDRNVHVEVYENMGYSCCGLIKDLNKK